MDIGALAILHTTLADAVCIPLGKLYAVCNGLHIYDYNLADANAVVTSYRSLVQFVSASSAIM